MTGILLALLAGAGSLGLLQGLLRLPGTTPLFGQTVPWLCVAGDWGVVLLFALTLALVARSFPRLLSRLGGPAGAFWAGWSIALLPFARNLLEDAGFAEGRRAFLAASAIALLFLVAAPRIGGLWGPGPRLRLALVLLSALAPLWGIMLYSGTRLDLDPPSLPTTVLPRPAIPVDPQHPDLILISVDTLRADAVVGPSRARTPVLDRLYANGAWAPYALSSSNQTLPGHVGMLSGTTAAEHGVRSNRDGLPADLPMLAERLRKRGWNTAAVVSNGLLSGAVGFARGFDAYDDRAVAHAGEARLFLERMDHFTWLGLLLPTRFAHSLWSLDPNLHALRVQREVALRVGGGSRVADHAIALLDRLRSRPGPGFLFVHFMDVHAPYGAPPPYRDPAREPSLPPGYRLDRDGRVDGGLLDRIEKGLAAGDPRAREALAFARARYLEEVSFVDDCIGRLLDHAAREDRPLVVIVTGDHGEQFGEHRLTEHADSLWEPNLRVPFVMWGNGIPGRQLPPVALSMVAAALLNHRPPTGLGADSVQIARDDRRVALRRGDLKWVLGWRRGRSDFEDLGCFDLRSDPAEEHPLGPAAIPVELRAAFARFRERDGRRIAEDGESVASDPTKEALLRSLGYATAGEEGNQ